MKYGQNIGMDFGTSNMLAYIRDKGVIAIEPSVAAVERTSGRVVAIGTEAKEKMNRFPERFDAARPIGAGMIINYRIAADMLGIFLKKVCAKQILKPRVTVGIPIRAGEVSERAMTNALLDAGAISVTTLRTPFAAAMGIGIPLSEGGNAMIIDIGEGSTDISVISRGKMAIGTSTEAAGKRMTRDIMKYMRRNFHLELGECCAEYVKITAGCLKPKSKDILISVRGRNIKTGLPETVELSSDVFPQIFSPTIQEICDLSIEVLDKIPSEIKEDIQRSGIYLTGGGSQLEGMEEYFTEAIGISCKRTKNPLQSVVMGAGMWQ